MVIFRRFGAKTLPPRASRKKFGLTTPRNRRTPAQHSGGHRGEMQGCPFLYYLSTQFSIEIDNLAKIGNLVQRVHIGSNRDKWDNGVIGVIGTTVLDRSRFWNRASKWEYPLASSEIWEYPPASRKKCDYIQCLAPKRRKITIKTSIFEFYCNFKLYFCDPKLSLG